MQFRHALPVVLLLALVALSGCSESAGSLYMNPVDDEALADNASRPVETDGAAVTDSRSAIRRAITTNGSATAAAPVDPVRHEWPFRYDGSYYNVSTTVVGSERAYDVDIEVDYNASTINGSVVDYAALPAVDRQRVDSIVQDSHPPDYKPGFQLGASANYNRSEANASVLVTDQKYEAIRYEEELYRIRVDVDRTTIDVYRFNATLVAENQTAYARQLRRHYAFTLSGLSENETAIVREAVEGRFYADDEDNEAFGSLVSRFRTHEAVERDSTYGSWLVRYKGRLYWAGLGFPEYTTEDP